MPWRTALTIRIRHSDVMVGKFAPRDTNRNRGAESTHVRASPPAPRDRIKAFHGTGHGKPVTAKRVPPALSGFLPYADKQHYVSLKSATYICRCSRDPADMLRRDWLAVRSFHRVGCVYARLQAFSDLSWAWW